MYGDNEPSGGVGQLDQVCGALVSAHSYGHTKLIVLIHDDPDNENDNDAVECQICVMNLRLEGSA